MIIVLLTVLYQSSISVISVVITVCYQYYCLFAMDLNLLFLLHDSQLINLYDHLKSTFVKECYILIWCPNKANNHFNLCQARSQPMGEDATYVAFMSPVFIPNNVQPCLKLWDNNTKTCHQDTVNKPTVAIRSMIKTHWRGKRRNKGWNLTHVPVKIIYVQHHTD